MAVLDINNSKQTLQDMENEKMYFDDRNLILDFFQYSYQKNYHIQVTVVSRFIVKWMEARGADMSAFRPSEPHVLFSHAPYFSQIIENGTYRGIGLTSDCRAIFFVTDFEGKLFSDEYIIEWSKRMVFNTPSPEPTRGYVTRLVIATIKDSVPEFLEVRLDPNQTLYDATRKATSIKLPVHYSQILMKLKNQTVWESWI